HLLRVTEGSAHGPFRRISQVFPRVRRARPGRAPGGLRSLKDRARPGGCATKAGQLPVAAQPEGAASPMRRAVIKTSAGHTAFDLEEPGDFPSFFVFAMHKSGSTLMNRMLDQALSAASVPQVPLPSIAFEAGLPANEILNPEELIFPEGYCYRNFHGFP